MNIDFLDFHAPNPVIAAIALLFLVIQLPFVAVWLARLLQGPTRRSPLQPQNPTPDQIGKVSVIVPTLNEAQRISPCLAGLTRQTYELREILVVDSRSEDETVDLVKTAQRSDPRFRVIYDDPLPDGWVGRPWALHNGFLNSSQGSEWILGIDADTQPQPGLIPSLLQAVEASGYDLVSLSPQFILKTLGEFWLQPALLMTLVYRFGPAGAGEGSAERVMANGQCFFCRRSLLEQLEGYTSARQSFCDDVTLARVAAESGAKVGFWDGAKLIKVRMYEGMAETWTEWGRSLDLKDAATSTQTWGDALYLSAIQGLPMILLAMSGILLAVGQGSRPVLALFGVNAVVTLARFALLWAIAPSYDFSQAKASWTYWLSPFADPLAVLRIWLSASKTPTRWRGRQYG